MAIETHEEYLETLQLLHDLMDRDDAETDPEVIAQINELASLIEVYEDATYCDFLDGGRYYINDED